MVVANGGDARGQADVDGDPAGAHRFGQGVEQGFDHATGGFGVSRRQQQSEPLAGQARADDIRAQGKGSLAQFATEKTRRGDDRRLCAS